MLPISALEIAITFHVYPTLIFALGLDPFAKCDQTEARQQPRPSSEPEDDK